MGGTKVMVYVMVTCAIIILDIVLGIFSLKKEGKKAVYLGRICFLGAVVTVFYVVTAFLQEERLFSVFSSLYFIAIDFLVANLVFFIYSMSARDNLRNTKLIKNVIYFLACADAVIFLINIFNNMAVSYQDNGADIMRFDYAMHELYIAHLIFDYALIIIAVAMLIHEIVRRPAEYRTPFSLILSGVILVVFINAFWLFFPGAKFWSNLDYSVWGYSIAEYFCYWTCFRYSVSIMPEKLRNFVMESIDQGIVLFDPEDEMILCNERARRMLPDKCFDGNVSAYSFAAQCGVKLDEIKDFSIYSTQVVIEENENAVPMRLDFHMIENRKKKLLGRLFVFSDFTMGIDLLTGFHTIESFEKVSGNIATIFDNEVTVIIMDLIGLKNINYNEGRRAGDDKIRRLANVMREVFPKNSFFVRGQDANLMCICIGINEDLAREFVRQAQEKYTDSTQYAIGTKGEGSTVSETISNAERALRARKLMDKQSHHSEILNSMLVALQECDKDTEKHVERTQEMGAELGKRINLSEVEQSDLSLLCIMHDIGKIAIPLEILNKPSKLTDAEFAIMKTHAEKGYQIASSNQEFQGIAEMVKYHHERWDGRGYPDGLKGDEIPKLSRVISIVDSYDAMVNDRIYRPALDPEDAMAEILRCAGTQFDPYIAAKFVEMLREPQYKKIHSDISAKVRERKEEQKEKKKLHDRLMSMTDEVNPDNVVRMDYGKIIMARDGSIISGNEMFSKISGYNKEDWEETELYLGNLIFEEDFRLYVNTVSTYVKKGETAFFKMRLKSKDGTEKKVECTARVFYDSTDRTEKGELIILREL